MQTVTGRGRQALRAGSAVLALVFRGGQASGKLPVPMRRVVLLLLIAGAIAGCGDEGSNERGRAPSEGGSRGMAIEDDPAAQAGYVEGYLLKGIKDGRVEQPRLNPGVEVTVSDATCEQGRDQLFYCEVAAIDRETGTELPRPLHYLARYDPGVDDRAVEAAPVGGDPAVICESGPCETVLE